jgi:hypothetical protein
MAGMLFGDCERDTTAYMAHKIKAAFTDQYSHVVLLFTGKDEVEKMVFTPLKTYKSIRNKTRKNIANPKTTLLSNVIIFRIGLKTYKVLKNFNTMGSQVFLVFLPNYEIHCKRQI